MHHHSTAKWTKPRPQQGEGGQAGVHLFYFIIIDRVLVVISRWAGEPGAFICKICIHMYLPLCTKVDFFAFFPKYRVFGLESLVFSKK